MRSNNTDTNKSVQKQEKEMRKELKESKNEMARLENKISDKKWLCQNVKNGKLREKVSKIKRKVKQR